MIFKKLFEPIVIKGIQVNNRLLMPPMHANLGNQEDGITDSAIDLYVARAKGGFGIIGVGVIDTYFVEGASSPIAFFLDTDKHLKRHAQLIKQVRKYGTRIYGQIGVRRIWPASELHKLPKLSTLSADKIEAMVDSMVKASVRVREAGYDAVDIAGMGGGAVAIFMSKLMNDRTDKWGGLGFPVEIIKGIRKTVGNDYPIFFRLTSSEFIPGGYNIEDVKRYAQQFVAAGVNCIVQTGGSHATTVPQMTANVPRGTYAFLAREIKSAVNVPVSASVRINHPILAENVLRKGWSDLITVARGSLADPAWPNKAKRGEIEEINLCIACNECMDAVVGRDLPVCCTVNPKMGRVPEVKPLPKVKAKKQVLVIGGGVTGLQAALTCAERGHKVTLIEKGATLGGKWPAAATPHGREELLPFLHWLFRQVKKLGVDIRTGAEATPSVVRELAPDAIIVCSGSKPIIPNIPGINQPHVVLAQDVLEAKVKFGNKVAVIGAGGVGVETAEFLAKRRTLAPEVSTFLLAHQGLTPELAQSLQKGPEVTLIEQQDKLGLGLGPSSRWVILKDLRATDVKSLVNTKVTEIKKDGVVVKTDGKEQFVPADTVVIAAGFATDNSIYESVKKLAPEVYLAGTAAVTGHTIVGIGNAFEIALKI